MSVGFSTLQNFPIAIDTITNFIFVSQDSQDVGTILFISLEHHFLKEMRVRKKIVWSNGHFLEERRRDVGLKNMCQVLNGLNVVKLFCVHQWSWQIINSNYNFEHMNILLYSHVVTIDKNQSTTVEILIYLNL